ncbi:MAG: CorA family divalent cation transporter [Minisyncoccia bacterium]|jgi:magnesium transporter
MIKKTKINRITWFQLQSPKERDVKELEGLFEIHPIIQEEIYRPSDRSKVENYGDYVFAVYHLPIYNEKERTSRRAELDFIATKDTVITVSYEKIDPLAEFAREVGKNVGLKNNIQNPAQLIYYVLQEVNVFSLRQLRHVEKKVNVVGAKIFKQPDQKLLEEISYIKRDLLDFGIIAAAQKTTLESLLRVGTSFWGKEVEIYLSDLLGDFLKVHYLLENLRATIVSYSETVSQIFQFHTSNIVRRFSILGFLSFPLLLYATITLQPQIAPTLFADPREFWLIFILIIAILIGLLIIFRKKGWF